VFKDVKLWEDTGSAEPLIERVRRLSTNLEKEDKSLYAKALKVCSRFSDFKRKRSKIPVVFNIDTAPIFLPSTLGLQGEPAFLQGEPTHNLEGNVSDSQSCIDIEDPSKDHFRFSRQNSLDRRKWIMSSHSNLPFTNDEESQPGSESWCLIQSRDVSDDEGVVVNHIDEKLAEDLDRVWVEELNRTAIILDKFPGVDFQKAIMWMFDTTVYTAKNIKHLRIKHNVLVESAFQKRCRGFKWRSYYGFILRKGVMLYFREEMRRGIRGMVFKKSADLRNNTIRRSSNKRLTVITNERSWLLKFSTRKHIDTWEKVIRGFSS